MPRTRSGPAVTDPEAIRLRLRALVEADGRALAEIARAAGMPAAHLYQVLSGRRVSPSAPTVGKILAALGLPWSALD